jgi:hypothetical protein
MKRVIWGLGLAGWLVSVPAAAQVHPTYESLWADATKVSSCVPSDHGDFILVSCNDELLTLWYFTKPNHPAHPGVIKRTFVQEVDGWHAHENGYSFATDEAQPAFKAWLAQIVDLDRQMKEDIDKKHGSSPSQNPN